jgi:hypothetical protein
MTARARSPSCSTATSSTPRPGCPSTRGQSATKAYHSAYIENGDHMDGPSEAGLFMLLQDLGHDVGRDLTIWLAARDYPSL